MIDFFDMGRHSVFIWSSYGLVFALLIILAMNSIRGQKQSEKEVEQLRPTRGNRRRQNENDDE
jgi:heme exporter protein CcmD